MLDEDKIMQEAIIRCYREMYRKAQPRGNFDELRRKVKNGEIPKDTRIYERYYLPQKEYEYIVNKYVKAYGFSKQWDSDVDLILSNLKDGAYYETYDESCSRTSGKTKPLKNIIGEKNANKVIEIIENLKMFYAFDRKESIFRASVALGCSPTSNPNTVKEYWKSQGVDIEINEKKELTEDDYWEIDYYGHIAR